VEFEELFDDVDEAVIDEDLDIDEAVDILYAAIYGDDNA
jgi:hypothetical protein